MFLAPDKTGVQLSPDGKYIGYISPYNRVPNIFLQKIEDAVRGISTGIPVTNDPGPGIRNFQWTHIPGVMMYTEVGGAYGFPIPIIIVCDKGG